MANFTDQHLHDRWTPWHDRLHRHLLHHPELLPDGSTLLLALSGGQDSMALVGLLTGLRRLHSWQIHLWHGDHRWHPQSASVAKELEQWCHEQHLTLRISHAEPALTATEAKARQWRYGELDRIASSISDIDPTVCCRHVVTGHTASDSAETFLLQLARGTDLAGLVSLRPQRALNTKTNRMINLVRPLLVFSRSETNDVCETLRLPVWIDPSNANPKFTRNRLRQKVMPVLQELYPGCEQRITSLSHRLSKLHDTQTVLTELALESLKDGEGLQRKALAQLPQDVRRTLLAHWLHSQGVSNVSAEQLEELSEAIAPRRPGQGRDLSGGWRIEWVDDAVRLINSAKNRSG